MLVLADFPFVDRAGVGNRIVRDNDSARVHRETRHVALEAQRSVHLGMLLEHLRSLREGGDRVFERRVQPRVTARALDNQVEGRLDFELRDPVDAGYVVNAILATVLNEVPELPDMILPEHSAGFRYHLVPPIVSEVEVYVREIFTGRVDESLKHHRRELHRIDLCDPEEVADERGGGTTASRSDRDAVPLRPSDEIGERQEVI